MYEFIMNLQVRVSSMRTCAHSSAQVIKFSGALFVSGCWSCPAVWCWNGSFFVFFILFRSLSTYGWVILHPSPSQTPTSSPSHIHTQKTPNPTLPPQSQSSSHIKKLITVRKCRMTPHRDITVGVGVFLIATPTQPPHRLLSFSENIHSASVCPHFKLGIQIWDVSLRGRLHIAIYAYSRFPFLPLPLRDAWFVDNVVMLGAMCVRVRVSGLDHAAVYCWFLRRMYA